MEIKAPSKVTLKKYGLSEQEWLSIFDAQGRKCLICEQTDKKWVIDHAHVKGFKKMSLEDRKKYVRGILCTYCNFRMLPKGMNLQKAKNIVSYLETFESRLKND